MMPEVNFKRMANDLSGRQSRTSSVLLITIILLVGLILAWAAVTELDNVTRGAGKTVSESQNQLVQSSEAGVLRVRHVTEGDVVERGDPLFDIDPVDAKGQLEQAEKRRLALRAQMVRFEAEVAGIPPEFGAELTDTAPGDVVNQTALYVARKADLDAQVAILEQRLLARQAEIEATEISGKTAEKALELIRSEIASVEPLVKAGIAPETRLITLKRDEEENIGRAASALSSRRGIEAGLEEIARELAGAKQSYVTRALTEMTPLKLELGALDSVLPALRDRVERTSIRSPIKGVVNRINFRTEGAYVQPGDVLLEIVPAGEDLIVEARVDPKNIPDVVIGNDVRISLTAFDALRYGRLDGKVLNISADALTDTNTGEVYYQVGVSLDTTFYEDNGEAVLLLPGMVATIEVLSGKRTVLDYFWQPLARVKERAFED